MPRVKLVGAQTAWVRKDKKDLQVYKGQIVDLTNWEWRQVPSDLKRMFEIQHTPTGGSVPIHGSRLFHMGHSVGVGGATNPVRGWPNRLAALLRSQDIGASQGGAALTFHERGQTGDGGWVPLFNAHTPAPGQAPYVPVDHLPLLHYGNNDLGWIKRGRRDVFLASLRAALARIQAGRVYEDDHASVTYSAGWPAPANVPLSQSGASLHQMPGAPAVNWWFELAVPADFHGGEINVGFVMAGTARPFTGLLECRVDGVRKPEHDIDFSKPEFAHHATGDPVVANSPVVHRVTGLAPGAHTVRFTAPVAIGVWGFLDWWSIRAQPDPVVLVCELFKPPSYIIWPEPRPNDDDVDYWNEGLKDTCAEFDGVQVIGMADFPKDLSYFIADGVHPNDLGHAHIAEMVYSQIAAMELPVTTIALQSREAPSVALHKFKRSTAVVNIPNSVNFGNLVGAGAAAFMEIKVAANIGDTLKITPNFLVEPGAAYGYFDVVLNPGSAAARFVSSDGGPASTPNGITGWLCDINRYIAVGSPVFISLRQEHIPAGGMVIVRLQARQSAVGATRGMSAIAPNFAQWAVENLGQPVRVEGYG